MEGVPFLLVRHILGTIQVFSTENNQKLTQSFTEEKKGLDFSPRSGEATSGEATSGEK